MIGKRSEELKKTNCDECSSSDGNSIYRDTFDDGRIAYRTYCYVCRKPRYNVNPEGFMLDSEVNPAPTRYYNTPKVQTSDSSFKPKMILSEITDRKISRDTAETFGVKVLKDAESNITAHVYPFYEKTGKKIVAYKKRNCSNKAFTIHGPEGSGHQFDQAVLFGQQLFNGRGKYVTITEGELDAMAAYQMLGSKWPVVSLRNGAAAAEKDIRKNLDFFDRYDKIVLCLDNDEPGRKASEKLSEIFEIGKCVIVPLSKKDPADYLKSGETALYTREWWNAKPLSPDGIISGEDIWDIVSTEPENNSIPYPWEELNNITYGIRRGEIVTITAGSGIGKSAIMREIIYNILHVTEDANIGAIFLEESIRRTALGLMSIHANKQLHLPVTVYTEEEQRESFDSTVGCGRVFLYDHFGSADIDNIVSRIRYMIKGLECTYIFLDHLSIIVSSQDNGDERKALDESMTKLRMLVQETNVALFIVSHLKRPQNGGGHEIGGVTTLAQLRGSAGIAQLSDMVVGLERNSQDDDPIVRNTTIVRVLKNRFSGETGPASRLLWNKDTGRLSEQDMDEDHNEPDDNIIEDTF